MADDIEAIEDTIPKLEEFYSTYGRIANSVDDVLCRLTDLRASSTTMDGINVKHRQLQVCTCNT